MTTYTASLFFLGQYRPAYFEGATAGQAARKAILAVAGVDEPRWFVDRLVQCELKVGENCTSMTCEHGARGVGLCIGPHDPWLDSATRDLPPYPGLDYAEIVNA